MYLYSVRVGGWRGAARAEGVRGQTMLQNVDRMNMIHLRVTLSDLWRNPSVQYAGTKWPYEIYQVFAAENSPQIFDSIVLMFRYSFGFKIICNFF